MRWSKAWATALLIACCAVISVASDVPFVHKKKYAMGTVFEIVAYDSSVERASTAIDKAFAELIRLDGMLSNYEPDSELSVLNRSAHFQPMKVSTDLYHIIEASISYSKISKGEFDITVGPLVDLWKRALQTGTEPSAQEQAAARNCVGYERIDVLPGDKIEFRSPCMRIDVGGIGKGYAVDRAADILRSSGISRALIDAGGSTMYALGSPPGYQGWLVHMRDPSGHIDPQITMVENSVSTSEQSPPGVLQTVGAGHIIDPDSGTPVQSNFAVSVIAPSATASDALSTTLLLMGPQEGKRIVRQITGSAAVWIAASGEIQMASSGPEIVIPRGAHKMYASQK